MGLPSCFGLRVSLRETEEAAWLRAIRPHSAAPDARTELRKNDLRSMGSIRPHRSARCNIAQILSVVVCKRKRSGVSTPLRRRLPHVRLEEYLSAELELAWIVRTGDL